MPCGTVQKVKENRVVVTMERQDMCGDCHACEMIGGKKACKLTCIDEIGCENGDRVEVELGKVDFLKATYIMYGLPLLGFIIGLFGGYGLSNVLGRKQDLWMSGMGIIGVLVAFLLIKWGERKKIFNRYLPQVTRKIKG